MVTQQDVSALVQESIKGLNQEKEEGKKIPVANDTVLLGIGTLLDSLDFIVIISDIEERLYATTGQSIQLVVGLDAPEESNPFRDVESLSKHITALLQTGGQEQ